MRAYKLLFYILVLTLSISILGCAKWKSVPDSDFRSNTSFEVNLTTVDFMQFNVKLHNNSNNNISVIWDKTFYIGPSGGTNGPFTFGNEYYWEDKDIVPSPTVVLPGMSMERKIFPTANRYWKRGWNWNLMPLGKNGILLTVMIEGKEHYESLFLEFISIK